MKEVPVSNYERVQFVHRLHIRINGKGVNDLDEMRNHACLEWLIIGARNALLVRPSVAFTIRADGAKDKGRKTRFGLIPGFAFGNGIAQVIRKQAAST